MTTLAEELHIGAGTKALVVSAPKSVREALADLPDGASIATSGRGPFGVVLVFAPEKRDVEGVFRTARAALGGGGALWIAYPKEGSGVKTDISRDDGWDVLADRGWAPVAEVTLDDTWSALRFEHDPALKTQREKVQQQRSAEKPTVSLKRADGGDEAPKRHKRREAATVSLRGPGLVPEGHSDDSVDESARKSDSDD